MKYTWVYIFIIITAMLYLNCRKDEPANANTTKTRKAFPDQEGWNSTLYATTNGQLSALIKYGYMQRFTDKKEVLFSDKIAIDFYDEMGQHTSKLTADSGRLDEGNNNVIAIGNVVVISDSGNDVYTEKLWWDQSIEKIISDTFVTIITADQDTFFGTDFKSNQTFDVFTIREFRGKTNRAFDLSLKRKDEKADSALVKEKQ